MTDILRAGVAGAGVFGGYHANKYLEVSGASLHSIFDVDPLRADAAAVERKAEGYADFSAFLGSIDILTIATPATTHAMLAERALEAGVHVLVEKPIAMDLAAADRLIAAAKNTGRILQVGHQERYVADAFGLLSRGSPTHLRSRRLNKFSGRAMDVSVVFDLMIHDLDLLAQLTSVEGALITSLSANRTHGTCADYVDVGLVFSGGLTAQLTASRLQEAPLRDLMLTYSDGEVGLDFLGRMTRNTTPTPMSVTFESAEKPAALIDPLRFGTQSFVDAVRANEQPKITGADGRAALVLALMIENAVNAMME